MSTARLHVGPVIEAGEAPAGPPGGGPGAPAAAAGGGAPPAAPPGAAADPPSAGAGGDPPPLVPAVPLQSATRRNLLGPSLLHKMAMSRRKSGQSPLAAIPQQLLPRLHPAGIELRNAAVGAVQNVLWPPLPAASHRFWLPHPQKATSFPSPKFNLQAMINLTLHLLSCLHVIAKLEDRKPIIAPVIFVFHTGPLE